MLKPVQLLPNLFAGLTLGAEELEHLGHPERIFPTIWVGMLLSTLLTGLFLYVLGDSSWDDGRDLCPIP